MNSSSPSPSSRDSNSRPEVAVILLNWNSYQDTADCIRSLETVEYPNLSVYVADNGSTDGSGKQLAAEFDRHEFVFNGDNLGFAAGCNPAIERAIADDADYVLLLNNDTIVDSDFLTPLVETAESNDDIAAVSGVVLDEAGDVWSAGGTFYPPLVKLSHEREPGDTVYETEFITGALMLLPGNFISELGGLNEAYFFGMEDEELAWKARQRGKKLLIDPRSRITHDAGSSAAERSPFRYYHDARNRLQFAATNLTVPLTIVFALFFVLSRSVRFLQWGLRGRWDLIWSTVLATVDFFTDADHRTVSELN